MNNKVYISGFGPRYAEMFINNDWEIVASIEEADLVCFIGGADVSPHLYGEKPIPETSVDAFSDERDMKAYDRARSLNKPCVGICRGAQFLNVMNDGYLWQDVDGHATSNGHHMINLLTDEYIKVSSTHHQMMIPADEGAIILGVAYESTRRKSFNCSVGYEKGSVEDTEVVFYSETSCLCYQPHPEHFNKDHECQVNFFEFVNHFLL